MAGQVQPDYYAVLGVSREASLEEIRRRYRQLVRQYHPDVSEDKEAAHQRFVRIVEAYQILSNPQRRRAYDAALSRTPEQVRAERARRAARRTAAQRERLRELLRAAEECFAREDYEGAIKYCQRMIALDPHNAEAHALWGDIYFEQREYERAIIMYSYAVQFRPESMLYAQKLQQAARQEQLVRERPTGTPPAGKRISPQTGETYRPSAWVNGVGAAALVGLVVWGAVRPGQLAFHQQMYTNLALSALGAAWVLGILLSHNRWLGPFDEELILTTVEGHPGGPIGIYLCVASLISIYLGLAFYFVIALLQEHLSPSILKAFAATFACVALYAVLAPVVWKTTVLFGGNFLFLALVMGWLFGSIGQRPW